VKKTFIYKIAVVPTSRVELKKTRHNLFQDEIKAFQGKNFSSQKNTLPLAGLCFLPKTGMREIRPGVIFRENSTSP